MHRGAMHLSPWLHAGLTKAEIETVLLETRQIKAALSAPRKPPPRLVPYRDG
jgi:hypothetical protein